MPIELNEENGGSLLIIHAGEKKWQHAMATFCKPFTKAAVRYFDHADAAEARKWLAEA